MAPWTGALEALGDGDLLTWFEVYLALVLLFTVALRAEHVVNGLLVFHRFRRRHPKLYQRVRTRALEALFVPGVVAALAAGTLLALHATFLRAAEARGELPISLLPGAPLALVAVLVAGGAMVVFDLRGLRDLPREIASDPPRIWRAIEVGLKGPLGRATGPLVDRYLVGKFRKLAAALNPWTAHWAQRMAARLVFGIVLWAVWWVL